MAAIDYNLFDVNHASTAEIMDLRTNKMKFYVNKHGETVGKLYIPKQPGEKRKIQTDSKISEIRKILSRCYEQSLRDGKLDKRSNRDSFIKGICDSLISNAPDLNIKVNLQQKREEVIQKLNELLDDCIHNLCNREKRFWRKAMFNMTKYMYFVTISYSDENFSDEEIFREKLKKWFSNNHSNHGTLVQGVFEQGGEFGRLHFHGLMYVPDGFFKDGLVKRKVFSTKKNKWVEINENPTLRRKFGQNDFSKLNVYNIVESIEYICKYVAKSGERFFYNRGIKGEALALCDVKKICFKSIEYVTHYLFDPDVKAYEIEERSNIDCYTDVSDVVYNDNSTVWNE